MYKKHRVDHNQKPLFMLARQLGCAVIETTQGGDGKPDGWVLVKNRLDLGWWPVEIKRPRGNLTPAQKKLHAELPDGAIKVWRVEADVFEHVGVGRRPVGGAE